MAHRGVWIPGVWKVDTGQTLTKGQFFKHKASAGGVAGSRDLASAGLIEICDTAGELPFGVAYSDMKAADLLDGHHAGPPSEIIEVKAGAAIAAGDEVMVSAAGEAVTLAGTDVHVVGIARKAVADGDLFELQVRPRFVPS